MAFYENVATEFPYIERAVLMEDIPLPVLNKKKKFTRKFFYSISRLLYSGSNVYDDNYTSSEMDVEYKFIYNELRNVTAKFYIPVLMTAFKSNNTEVNTDNRAPKTTGFVGNIKSLPYKSSNCVILTIPKYILMQFIDQKNDIPGVKDNYVPKGTEFLVACVGGHMDIDHMRIIGLYTLTYDKKSFPNLKDDYYGGNPTS